MSWRLAKSLETLRRQINTIYPARSKVSDGTIGDAAHSSRTSDHNPNRAGVVNALDITHDPTVGLDARKLAEALVASRDKRIKYIISNGEIVSSVTQPWKWRKYTGANGHFKHVHISVNADSNSYDDSSSWVLTGTPKIPERATLRRGDRGPDVVVLQDALNKFGSKLDPDGIFGSGTETAVKAFQVKNGLREDGIVGNNTWKSLGL